MEIWEAYNNLCKNRVLNEEFQIIEKKGIIRALDFPIVFKTKRIRIVLNMIHDGFFCMKDGLVEMSNKIIHRVTGYPKLEWPKTLRDNSKEAIEKKTRAKWNKRGMKIDTIKDSLV